MVMNNGNGNGGDHPRHFYFTIDCDWVPGSQVGLEQLLDLCDRYQLAATIFFGGRFAEAYLSWSGTVMTGGTSRERADGPRRAGKGRRLPCCQLRATTRMDPPCD